MNISEIMDELNEAIALVEEAKAKVDAAAKQAGCYSHYTAYGRYGFDTLLGNGNRYDASLFDMMNDLEMEEEEEESCY
jgi:hypothetical protein